jgi:hypothetical protein
MLIGTWERIRGYDRWTETRATIKSSTVAKVEAVWSRLYCKTDPIETWWSTCLIEWTDETGRSHSASYAIPEGSPLFQLYDGNTVVIRYDPSRPGQYHFPDLLWSRICLAIRSGLITIGCVGPITLLIWLWPLMLGGPE